MADREFWSGKRVLVTGGAGFIGSWVVRHLIDRCGVAHRDLIVPRSTRDDLRDPDVARRCVEGCDVVIHLAARSGGIAFSRAHPASQYVESTRMDFNVAMAAAESGVSKMIALGNLFAWSGSAPMPLRVEDLHEGLPTLAHRGVGLMKRNLALLAEMMHRELGFSFGVVYSANAYGPGDSLDRDHAHVIPATIMKCLEDPKLDVWGDGRPTRDFLFVEDLAAGLVRAAERLEGGSVVAIGSGQELSISEVIETIVRQTRFRGEVHFDASKAGGDARRCVDPQPALDAIGFAASTPFERGMDKTVAWYRRHYKLQLATEEG